MERSEPSLVPEWLKSSGSVTGVGALHPHSSSSSHSDDHPGSRLVRIKSSAGSINQDLGRLSSSDRNFSFPCRSDSSNGSSHSPSYSNFGRNNHGRDWDRDIHEYQDKNRKVFGGHEEKDVSPWSMSSGRFEKDGIRRSQSISGRRSEVWPKKPSAGSTVATCKSVSGSKGVLERDGYVGSMREAGLEKYFPPLASEERRASPEVGRVPSPGLSSSIHPSPSSALAFNSSIKWISALAEAPPVVGSSGTNISSGQPVIVSSSYTQTLSTANGLNMAETVVLGPLRAQTTPQFSTGSQRLEELAVKQCRQLIPVTPAMPKLLAINSVDKGKGGKLGQPQLPTSSLPSPSVHGGTVKANVLKTGNTRKLQVLKPARERNVIPSAIKDNSSSTDSSKAVNPPAAAASSGVGSSVSRGPNSSTVSPTAQPKHVLTVLEKRPTSQAQSRNDFFNLMRKKSMANASIVSDAQPGQTVSSTCIQVETGKVEVAPAPATSGRTNVSTVNCQNESEVKEIQGYSICNGDIFHAEKHLRNGKTSSSPNLFFSEEEEVAFLRSLGWEENSVEEGLTEEEISAFYRDLPKYMNSKPSSKFFRGVEPRFSLPTGLQAGAVGDAVCSRIGSSDLKLKS